MKQFSLQNDIEQAVKKYPALQARKENGRITLRGVFTARNEDVGIDIDIYQLEISFDGQYPYVFPKVIELEEKIPRQLDRHVKIDNTLCFSNPQEEYKLCRKGITLLWFLQQILNPHLCREYYREKKGNYPTGERSHGAEGIWEGYYELLGTDNKASVLEQLNQLLFRPLARNAQCYCGNGKKYKRCHALIAEEVESIGRVHAVQLFYYLKEKFIHTQ